jgi:hypothetical protein
MTSLLKVEWLKMRKYNAFWWVMIITAISYPGITLISYSSYQSLTNQPSQASQLAKMALGNPFSFPEVWHTVGYLSSLFIFIPAVVVIMLITNEYTFKTHRQNIIDGWGRNQFISSKLIDVILITALITILFFFVSLVTGINSQDRLIWKTWEQVYYVGLFALQTLAQLSIAFLIGFLVRKAFLALGIFLFYFLILENILVLWLKFKAHDEGRFLPLEISDRLIPRPGFMQRFDKASYDKAISEIPSHIWMTIILTTLIWLICYYLNRKRDLK